MNCPKCDAKVDEDNFKIVVWDSSADIEFTCPACEVEDDPFLSFDQEYFHNNV